MYSHQPVEQLTHTIDIHHLPELEQTATNFSNLNSCLINIFTKLTQMILKN